MERYDETGEFAPVLLEKPELTEHQERLYTAFLLLCPDRPVYMGGVGCIPSLAVFAMADEIGEDRLDFLALCRTLDGVYVASQSRKK